MRWNSILLQTSWATSQSCSVPHMVSNGLTLEVQCSIECFKLMSTCGKWMWPHPLKCICPLKDAPQLHTPQLVSLKDHPESPQSMWEKSVELTSMFRGDRLTSWWPTDHVNPLVMSHIDFSLTQVRELARTDTGDSIKPGRYWQSTARLGWMAIASRDCSVSINTCYSSLALYDQSLLIFVQSSIFKRVHWSFLLELLSMGSLI